MKLESYLKEKRTYPRYLTRDELGTKSPNEFGSKIQTYPELQKIAKDIAKQTGALINNKVKNVESEMPYKAQYVLEELIKILQEAV